MDIGIEEFFINLYFDYGPIPAIQGTCPYPRPHKIYTQKSIQKSATIQNIRERARTEER